MRIKIVLIVMVLVHLACAVQPPVSTSHFPTVSRRDYHALYEQREKLLAPETDARKAGYE